MVHEITGVGVIAGAYGDPEPRLRALRNASAGAWWALLLSCCTVVYACDYEQGDIEIDQARGTAGTGAVARDAGVKLRPHARYEDDPRDTNTLPSMDASIVDGAPDAHLPDAEEAADAVARTPDLVPDDTDANVSDPDPEETDAGEVETDPCLNGTLTCRPVPTTVRTDYASPLTEVTLSAVVDGHRFETRSSDDVAVITLPTNRGLWVRAEAAGYWSAEIAAFVPPAPAEYRGAADVLSTLVLDGYFGQAGVDVDESKGYVHIIFPANIPGARAEIGAPSAPAIVEDASLQAVPSDTLVAGGTSSMHFLNVEPGNVAPVATVPGYDCFPISAGLQHVVRPRTVMRILMVCAPASP